MIDSPHATLTDLFSAVSADLRGSDQDVLSILSGVDRQGAAGQLRLAAAMTAGEFLREAAETRDLDPARMVSVLCAAHADLVGPAQPAPSTGLILAGVRGYLRGDRAPWTSAELETLDTDPVGGAIAAVKVVAAALTWHARDAGAEPQDVAQRTLLALAHRGCGTDA